MSGKELQFYRCWDSQFTFYFLLSRVHCLVWFFYTVQTVNFILSHPTLHFLPCESPQTHVCVLSSNLWNSEANEDWKERRRVRYPPSLCYHTVIQCLLHIIWGLFMSWNSNHYLVSHFPKSFLVFYFPHWFWPLCRVNLHNHSPRFEPKLRSAKKQRGSIVSSLTGINQVDLTALQLPSEQKATQPMVRDAGSWHLATSGVPQPPHPCSKKQNSPPHERNPS